MKRACIQVRQARNFPKTRYLGHQNVSNKLIWANEVNKLIQPFGEKFAKEYALFVNRGKVE